MADEPRVFGPEMMQAEEFEAIVNDMCAGLPVTIAMVRLVGMLHAVVAHTGEEGAQALRTHVLLQHAADEEEEVEDFPL